jgi:hypothetical protein
MGPDRPKDKIFISQKTEKLIVIPPSPACGVHCPINEFKWDSAKLIRHIGKVTANPSAPLKMTKGVSSGDRLWGSRVSKTRPGEPFDTSPFDDCGICSRNPGSSSIRMANGRVHSPSGKATNYFQSDSFSRQSGTDGSWVLCLCQPGRPCGVLPRRMP